MTASKILIVDDAKMLREDLRLIFEAEQWGVLTASNGAEALQLALLERPAAVLCDLHMPVMDGYSFIERMHAEPDIRSIPLFIMTADDGIYQVHWRTGVPLDRILRKPFSILDMLTRVQRVVNLRKDHGTSGSSEWLQI